VSRSSTLRDGREFHEATLSCVASFFRAGDGMPTRDESTGRETVADVALFDSPCKIQSGALGSLIPTSQERRMGGREVTSVRQVVKLPVDENSVGLRPDDQFDVVEIGEDDDPQLLGQRFRIVAPLGQSYATTRRYAIESVRS
jgi:hypothetical protein